MKRLALAWAIQRDNGGCPGVTGTWFTHRLQPFTGS